MSTRLECANRGLTDRFSSRRILTRFMATSEQLDHLINLDKVCIVVERPIDQSLETRYFCGISKDHWCLAPHLLTSGEQRSVLVVYDDVAYGLAELRHREKSLK